MTYLENAMKRNIIIYEENGKEYEITEKLLIRLQSYFNNVESDYCDNAITIVIEKGAWFSGKPFAAVRFFYEQELEYLQREATIPWGCRHYMAIVGENSHGLLGAYR